MAVLHWKRALSGLIRAKLARETGYTLAVHVAGTGVSLGVQVILARTLGPDEFGSYVYVMAWITALVLLGKCGLDTAALRLLPEYMATRLQGFARGFMVQSRVFALIMSSLIALAGVAFVAALELHATLAATFFVAAPLLPLVAYLLVQGSMLQAFNRIALSQIPQVLVRPVAHVVFLLAGVWYLGLQASASLAMLLNGAATLLAIGVTAIVLRRETPQVVRDANPMYHSTRWARMAFPMLLITSFNLVINQADIMLVGAMMSPKDAGIYSVASRLTMMIAFAITLVNSVVAPTIAKLCSEGRRERLQDVMTNVTWASLLVSSPIFVAILAEGDFILSLFGDEFRSGISTLHILAVSRFINAMTGAAGYLLSMSGHHTAAAIILGFSATANVVLNVFLIPQFGQEGAAVATLVTTVLWALGMAVYANYRIGVKVVTWRLPKNWGATVSD